LKVDEKICVLNAGGWGTALAVLLAGKGYEVDLWARRPELARQIALDRENPNYLSGVAIPRNVRPTSDLSEAVNGSSIVVVATIFRGLRELAPRLAALVQPDQLVVCAAKGLDEETLRRGSQILEAELPVDQRGRVVALSGPNHAEEVSRGIPTASVVASEDEEAALRAQAFLSAATFRVYTNPDIVGVELCGALKNVVAIAAGMSDGLGYGDNAKAALITRSLAEISRLVVEEGARPYTVAGMAGIGDIIATCTSHHSRNRAAGEAIARGKSVDQVIASSPMVVEGIPTTRAILKLARRKGVEMPITRQVHAVLFEGISPRQGMAKLMMRESTSEPWM
jgi:glycerol-3-phosphate dehydrogenase (NAD(P)+)